SGEAPKRENGKVKVREVDFIAIAMAAAAVPEIAGKCRENSVKDSQNIANELTVDLNSTMYLNDIAQSYNTETKLFDTRPSIGAYVENTMTKGRDAAAKAIEQYQNGDKKALVDIIANGLAFASRHFVACQASTSAATRAMNRFMNAYVDMMEADPELNQAVRERCAQLKAEAAVKKEQNLAAKEAFKAAHMDEINTVSAEMKRTNASLSDKKNKLTGEQEQEVIRNQHKFIEEQHPDYYDHIEKLANYDALNVLYDVNTELDVDKTIHGLRRQLRATDAITKGIDAKKRLMTAEFENTSLTAEEKEGLMKDIIRGELVLYGEKTGALKGDVTEDEVNKNNEGFAFVFDKKNLPAQRISDPELFNKDLQTSSKVSSLVSVLLEISSFAKKKDTASAVTDLITDPENGDAALDQFISDAFPQKDAFKNMKPKYLLDVVKRAPETIAKVQKNAIAQKPEQQKAAELQNNKNLSKAAEQDNKVLAEDPQLAN
ncbi:MAG: hypothetical protein MJ186_04575, partial [Clostridia bacterium]|nr:hypothetical protein [Clostridia bacterium]